ncbi:MAG: MarR family transcriptional regulator [Paludibacter sp.]|nr:MarR family transcriptional regulator [Paludibacter sp.]
MESKKYPFGMTVGGMMHEVMRLLKKCVIEHGNITLTMEQLALLIAISCNKDEVILQDMATSMGKDKSAILRTIDSIEAKELIKRVSDTTDRRKKYLMITKKGERVIEQYMEIELELTNELQKGLSEEEIATFYKVVNHIKTRTKEI